MFTGPHGYVSPSWYASKRTHGGRVVPTWNYLLVHAAGRVRTLDDDETLRHLHAQTDRHEHAREHPWRVDDAPDDYVRRLRAAIVGFELHIDELHGKLKMSQNKSADDVRGVVNGMRNDDARDDTAALVDLRDALRCGALAPYRVRARANNNDNSDNSRTERVTTSSPPAPLSSLWWVARVATAIECFGAGVVAVLLASFAHWFVHSTISWGQLAELVDALA